MTWFGYENHEDWIDLVEGLQQRAEYFAAQEEICPTTQRRHLQMAVRFKRKPQKMSTKFLPKQVRWKPMICDKMRNGERDWRAFWYCMKDETKAPEGRRFVKAVIPVPAEILDRASYSSLRAWQKEIFDSCDSVCREDRMINWVFEEQGNMGKSYLVRAMHDEGRFTMVNVHGRRNDIEMALFEYVEKWRCGPQLIVVDVPRVNRNGVSIAALEEAKNGLIFSTKYKVGEARFQHPHIWVFANQPPEVGQLSPDRWNIKQLVGEGATAQLRNYSVRDAQEWHIEHANAAWNPPP